MKNFTDIIKQLTLLTQFGLSLITPLLMCLGVCWWLCSRFSIGGWIYMIGFIWGMGSFAMVAYKLYLREIANQEKEKKENKQYISFNRHV